MRAPWLEPGVLFEGVGAHELNHRYDRVDEHDFDEWEVDIRAPALMVARRAMLAASATLIRLDGIDVSHYQNDAGPFDWYQVGAIPTWWGACKLTQSTSYRDPTAAFHRLGMMAAGLTHSGIYHWLSSTTDPISQALWFVAKMGRLRRGEFAMLDAEEAGITVDKCLAWCETVEEFTLCPACIYTGAYVANGTIWQSPALRESRFGPRPFTLAAYTTEARARSLPGVKDHPWDAWQYSSNGPVPGVTGRCDMNRVDVHVNFDLAAALNVIVVPPPPPPIERPPVIITPNLTPATTEELTTMPGEFVVVANSDDRSNPARWAWNGLILVQLSFDDHLRYSRCGMYRDGHGDLENPEWMTAVELSRYRTV